MPYSIHRVFNVKEYKPGDYVVASEKELELDRDLIARGEKPSVYLEFPVDVWDFELIDLFNWQDEVQGMISQFEWAPNHEKMGKGITLSKDEIQKLAEVLSSLT